MRAVCGRRELSWLVWNSTQGDRSGWAYTEATPVDISQHLTETRCRNEEKRATHGIIFIVHRSESTEDCNTAHHQSTDVGHKLLFGRE